MAYVTGGKIVLTKKLNPGDTTLYANADLGITAGRLYFVNDNQVEWMNFTGKALVGSDWTYTGLTRQLSQTADPATSAGSGYTWLAASEGKVVAMHDQLPDRQQGFKPGIYANAAARDAAIPSPANGMSCYLTAEGYFTDYQSGAWQQRANGATANASTTVAGKVETATDAEITASTDTGGTGALLHVLPSQVMKAISLAGADTTVGETDYLVFSKISDAKNYKILKSDLRNTLASSNTLKGTARMATDAEATTGTDQATYVNPKQAKDNYGSTILASDVVVAQSTSTASSSSATYVKAKEFVCNKSGTYRITFSISGSNIGSTIHGRIYKNGVAYGTERSATDVAWTFNEDLSFTSGDLIQIYQNASGGGTCFLYNAYVKASAFPTSAIPTVNL